MNKLANILFNDCADGVAPCRLVRRLPPRHFVGRLEECNAILGQQQIESISNTLGLMEAARPDKLETMKRMHVQKCVAWCQKNHLPYNRPHLSANAFAEKQ